jgi:hypothetical protein
MNQGVATNSRAIALQVARSLQQQHFFYEIEWGGRVLFAQLLGRSTMLLFSLSASVKGGYDLVLFVCPSNLVWWYRQSQISQLS